VLQWRLVIVSLVRSVATSLVLVPRVLSITLTCVSFLTHLVATCPRVRGSVGVHWAVRWSEPVVVSKVPFGKFGRFVSSGDGHRPCKSGSFGNGALLDFSFGGGTEGLCECGPRCWWAHRWERGRLFESSHPERSVLGVGEGLRGLRALAVLGPC